jgi:phage gp36-like protein
MAYSTLSDLTNLVSESVLVQLTDDEMTGAVDADMVAQAIADADAEIDGYCGKRYVVPFDPVPDLVAKMSADVALYNLYGRRDDVPEIRAERYKNAITFLKGVAAGSNSLGEDDPDTPGQGETPQITSGTRVFSRTSLRGW